MRLPLASKSCPSGRCIVKGAALALLAASVALGAAAQSTTVPPKLSQHRINEIVASPDRSEADRKNDIRRKPAQMLAFIGVAPGMVAVDLSTGGGYTTGGSTTGGTSTGG